MFASVSTRSQGYAVLSVTSGRGTYGPTTPVVHQCAEHCMTLRHLLD